MKVDKENNNTPVVIDNKASSAVSTQETPQKPCSKAASSPQIQLLNLAKNFGLAGGLKPIEKQKPIEERMLNRERTAHLIKQANMDSIIEKSLKYCSEHDASDRADPDWFSSFIELAEKVSNSTMQDLWAKILAGELSQPGSFSLKALHTFKNLTIYDAKLLAKACAIAFKDNSKKNIRLFSGSYQKPGLLNILDKQRELRINLSSFSIGHTELLALADNGLVFIQESELASMKKGDELSFKHNGTPTVFQSKKNNISLQFYKFTPVGAELALLIADKPDENTRKSLLSALSYHFNFK